MKTRYIIYEIRDNASVYPGELLHEIAFCDTKEEALQEVPEDGGLYTILEVISSSF